MLVNFIEALRQFNAGGRNRVLQFARDARPPAAYLGAQILPEMARTDYNARSGSMTIRSTMAGLVGMDSPYPEGGAVELGTFDERTAKIAIRQWFPEEQLRELQQFVAGVQLGGGNGNEAVVQAVFDFVDKLLVQPHLDRTEWLRWQALSTGAINWTFNQKTLLVSYGLPAGNFPASRTGTAGYGGSASTFWADHRAAMAALGGNVRGIYMHPTTLEMIIANTVNTAILTAQSDGGVTIQRVTTINGQNVLSADVRDRVAFISYGLEGEILNTTTPGQTIKIPFIAPGKLVYVGNNDARRFVIGQGSTPALNNTIGYVHLGPTVENSGTPGRWADVRVPDGQPWALEGRSASNVLPVIESTDKLYVLTTAVA